MTPGGRSGRGARRVVDERSTTTRAPPSGRGAVRCGLFAVRCGAAPAPAPCVAGVTPVTPASDPWAPLRLRSGSPVIVDDLYALTPRRGPHLMKHALIAATLLTVGGLAVGCGGNDSADSASGSASDNPSSASSSASGSASGSASAQRRAGAVHRADLRCQHPGRAGRGELRRHPQEGRHPGGRPRRGQEGLRRLRRGPGQDRPEGLREGPEEDGPGKLSSTQKTEVQQFLGYASQTCAPSAPSGGSTAGGSASGGASGGASSN